MNQSEMKARIWAVADLLRGPFRRSNYGRIILPFTVLRRFECVLEPHREQILKEYEKAQKKDTPEIPKIIKSRLRLPFYNLSKFRLNTLTENTHADLNEYMAKFSDEVREIFDYFEFENWIDRLDEVNLLQKVCREFSRFDLRTSHVGNHQMGQIFEHLLYKFAETANDTAGEFYTPRDVVKLSTALVLDRDEKALRTAGNISLIYDPACGTGGFLTEGMEAIQKWNPEAVVRPFGQELNPESYAIAKADMLMLIDPENAGQAADNIKLGDTLEYDQHAYEKFDYCLANPPFGVDWKRIETAIRKEHAEGGRFTPGLPRVSDGALLFLMHLISKMRPNSNRKGENGGRIAIILNGSPLFTGQAGGGESEIRRWILENDWLEAIIELPNDLFYNTGIATYIWLLSNNKPQEMQGQVQLVRAKEVYSNLRKSIGSKRNEIDENQRGDILRIVKGFENKRQKVKAHGESVELRSLVFPYTHFGYRRITIERPLQLAFDATDEERRMALHNDKTWAGWVNPRTGRQTIGIEGKRRDELDFALDGIRREVLCRDTFLAQVNDRLKERKNKKLTPKEGKLLQKHIGRHSLKAHICFDSTGRAEVDTNLRDFENVPLRTDIYAYFHEEVWPHIPELEIASPREAEREVEKCWIDEDKRDERDGGVGIVGYEINFNRYFYEYEPPRPLEEIDADLEKIEKEIADLLNEVAR